MKWNLLGSAWKQHFVQKLNTVRWCGIFLSRAAARTTGDDGAGQTPGHTCEGREVAFHGGAEESGDLYRQLGRGQVLRRSRHRRFSRAQIRG